jgi:toxin YoeB
VILAFSLDGWDDYLFWQRTDAKTLKKINGLIRECLLTPTEGSGHPERLGNELTGYWSRRIDHKNRLVYAITDTHVEIVQCRFHYDDR